MVYTPPAFGLSRDARTHRRDGPDLRDRKPATGIAPLDGTRMRTCELRYLRADARIGTAQPSIPAHPVFDSAFAAFARGTLIATTRGPVAVEDLDPGMKAITNERGPSPILWIGRMVWQGNADHADPPPETTRLTRIQTGALGLGRPMTDLLTGPGARILARGDGMSAPQGPERILRPIHDMVDGTHVITVSPPGEVELYHVGLRRHATITAAGLEFETFHPGVGFEHRLTHQQLSLFMALFPHANRPADFGSIAYARTPLGTGGRAVT